MENEKVNARRYHRPKTLRFDLDALDFVVGTTTFNNEEVGQFMRLLLHAWLDDHECTLPHDPVELAQIARCAAVSTRVLAKFRETDDGQLVNNRLLREWKNAKKRAALHLEKSVRGGKASVARRYGLTKGQPVVQPTVQPNSTSDSVSVSVSDTVKEKERENLLPPTPKAASEAGVSLANLLATKILTNNVNARITDTQRRNWGLEADLMMRIDHRTPEAISEIITWSQADPFWLTNILSMSKLRKQFDALTLRKNQKGQEHGPARNNAVRAEPGKYDHVPRIVSNNT